MAFILFTYGLLIIVSLYLKTDKMVDKKGLSRSMDVKDTSVLSYCANFINKYIDRLNQEDISEWTVKEVVNFLEKGDDDVCFSDYARKYNREMCIILRRKHMKNKYFILASMLMLGACTDFLDEKSTGTMSIDSDLSSIESCTALANAVKTLRADVYLTYAGYPALEALNRIRRRAELPDFTNPDKGVFRKAVWDERYFELCFEGKIWFDMVRTRKIRNDFDGTYYDFSGYRTVYGKQYTDQFLLFPLPQRELNANSQLTQNKGY